VFVGVIRHEFSWPYCTMRGVATVLYPLVWPLFGVEFDALDGHVPMGFEDFEAALFLLFVGVLVGKELLQQGAVVGIGVRGGGVLEDDRGAVVPSAVFRGVIARRVGEHLEDAAHLDLFLQHGIVILLEEQDELVGVAPLGLVVVLDDIGLVL